MAATLLSQLESMYPDSTRYRENYERFANRMDSLDHALQAIFADGPRTFVIYHPALSYMARDYGLTAAAVRSDDPEKVLLMNIQIDVAQRLARPVSYRYVIEFDQFGHGLSNGL